MPLAAAVQAGVGVLQAGIGAIQSIGANKRLKQLRQRRVAYQTPQEVFDAQNMALNEAQTGFGAQSTAAYKNQMDRGLSSSLGAATSLGANPNNIADILDRMQQGALDFSIKNEAMRYNKFTNVLSTTMAVAQGKTAEWADKEAKLKDDMAAQAMKAAAGNKNLQSGLNMALDGIANYEADKLYGEEGKNSTSNYEQNAADLKSKGAKMGRIKITSPTATYDEPMEEEDANIFKLDNYFINKRKYKF